MKNFLFLALGVALVLVVAGGVFYLAEPAVSAKTEATVEKAAPFVATRKFAPALVMVKNGEEVSPTMTMFEAGKEEVHRWVPSTFVANAGDTIILRVKNADVDCADEPPHGFSMAAFGVDIKEIPAGSEEVITIKADKPGVYTFTCGGENCAKDHGEQSGQLIVL